MNTDWLRAWRYLHKYALGMVLALGVYAVLRGSAFMPDLDRVYPLFVKADTNTILMLATLFLGVIVCAAFLDLLHHALGLAASTLWSLFALVAKKRAETATNWVAALMMPFPVLFHRTVKHNEALVHEFIYLISLGGMLHEGEAKLTKQDDAYFARALALLQSKSSEEVWYITYALQVTQDRREIDALQTEQVLALGYGSIGTLMILWTLQTMSTTPELVALALFAAGTIVCLAAAKYAVESKRKQVLHSIALFVQQFAWGEFAEVQDREAG